MEDAFDIFLYVVSRTRQWNPEFKRELGSYAETVTYRKGEYWLGLGRRNAEICFIKTGAAMSFRYRENVQDVTNLWNAGEVIIEGSTLLPKRHSEDRCLFLQDSEVLLLAVTGIENLQMNFGDAGYLLGQMLAKGYERLESLYYLMKFLPPDQRLKYTIERYALPFNLLTAVQKASYLGVSKQTLYNLL
jgi:hypothetical protein